MSKSEKDIKKSKFSYKRGLSYSIGQMSDITAYQTFTFLIFTFYYAVVGVSVILIMIGFIIWALWNSFNDFLIGYSCNDLLCNDLVVILYIIYNLIYKLNTYFMQ